MIDEQRLLKRCQRGENKAWKELFDKYFRHAYMIARAPPFSFEHSQAEDIAQDSLVDLCKNIRTVRRLRGYVGVVTHNKCVDWVRKKKEVLLTSRRDQDDCDEDPWQSIPDVHLPDVGAGDACAHLAGLVASLGVPCNHVLYLRFFGELSYKEIASKTATPQPQMGVQIARCLVRLRNLIAERPGLWEELQAML